VAVGIDQLANGLHAQRRAARRDDEAIVGVLELPPDDGLDADGRAIELELDLTAARQPDPRASGARASPPMRGATVPGMATRAD